ncbi:MAG: homocysteine S-methyltransferase family protein, partial [Gemmatimonadetes bacterium]|nr:homocysteine S-methyltransferase family protein [Gemmatimonadota bacterium]
MGTVLYGRGMFVNVCYDELNIKEPDLIHSVHADYVQSGAEIIETNTFGA